MPGWNDLVSEIKYNIEYGFHCSDLSFREMEGNICDALDRFAERNGLPTIDWEADNA